MFGTSGGKKESSYETISLNKINHVTPKQTNKKKSGEKTKKWRKGFRQLKSCYGVKIVPMKICSTEVLRSLCGSSRYSR